MKKIFAIIGAALVLGTSAFAQKQNNDPLAALKSAATSMAESILGEVITQTVGYKLEGEWIYNGMASAIETENVLTTVAASAYKESLEKKGIASPLEGEADALVFPDIEAGNVFYKTITLFSKAETAGMLAGTMAPVVLPSRSDSKTCKFCSLALAAINANSTK